MALVVGAGVGGWCSLSVLAMFADAAVLLERADIPLPLARIDAPALPDSPALLSSPGARLLAVDLVRCVLVLAGLAGARISSGWSVAAVVSNGPALPLTDTAMLFDRTRTVLALMGTSLARRRIASGWSAPSSDRDFPGAGLVLALLRRVAGAVPGAALLVLASSGSAAWCCACAKLTA